MSRDNDTSQRADDTEASANPTTATAPTGNIYPLEIHYNQHIPTAHQAQERYRDPSNPNQKTDREKELDSAREADAKRQARAILETMLANNDTNNSNQQFGITYSANADQSSALLDGNCNCDPTKANPPIQGANQAAVIAQMTALLNETNGKYNALNGKVKVIPFATMNGYDPKPNTGSGTGTPPQPLNPLTDQVAQACANNATTFAADPNNMLFGWQTKHVNDSSTRKSPDGTPFNFAIGGGVAGNNLTTTQQKALNTYATALNSLTATQPSKPAPATAKLRPPLKHATITHSGKPVKIAPFKDPTKEPYGFFANTTQDDKYEIKQSVTIHNHQHNFTWRSAEHAYHAQKIIRLMNKLNNNDPEQQHLLQVLKNIEADKGHKVSSNPDTYEFHPRTDFPRILNNYCSDATSNKRTPAFNPNSNDKNKFDELYNIIGEVTVSDGRSTPNKYHSQYKFEDMETVLDLQYQQHPDIRGRAIDCARQGVMPVEATQDDSIYGAGTNGNGSNMLGIIRLKLGNKFAKQEDQDFEPLIPDPKAAYDAIKGNPALAHNILIGLQLSTKPTTKPAAAPTDTSARTNTDLDEEKLTQKEPSQKAADKLAELMNINGLKVDATVDKTDNSVTFTGTCAGDNTKDFAVKMNITKDANGVSFNCHQTKGTVSELDQFRMIAQHAIAAEREAHKDDPNFTPTVKLANITGRGANKPSTETPLKDNSNQPVQLSESQYNAVKAHLEAGYTSVQLEVNGQLHTFTSEHNPAHKPKASTDESNAQKLQSASAVELMRGPAAAAPTAAGSNPNPPSPPGSK